MTTPSPHKGSEEKMCVGCIGNMPYGASHAPSCNLSDFPRNFSPLPPSPSKGIENWEEKFDEKFTAVQKQTISKEEHRSMTRTSNKTVKEFIRQILASHTARIKEIVEGKLRHGTKEMKCNCDGAITGKTCVAFEDGFNEGLSAVLKEID